MLKGSCLCGAIALEVRGTLHRPSACHCGQCRKQTGHFMASVGVADADLTVIGTPRWYVSSDHARRGFCATCGSTLFWKATGSDETAVAMGTLDGPTNLTLEKHIHVADKGDYYDIADGLPQEED